MICVYTHSYVCHTYMYIYIYIYIHTCSINYVMSYYIMSYYSVFDYATAVLGSRTGDAAQGERGQRCICIRCILTNTYVHI